MWNELADCAVPASVFLRHEWFEAALHWQHTGTSLYILVVTEGDRTIGICPLARSTGRPASARLSVIEFLSTPDAQMSDVICAPSDKPRVITALVKHLRQVQSDWDLIELDKLPGDSTTQGLLHSAFAEEGFRVVVGESSRNACILLSDNWARYYLARSPRLRKANNHIANRLREHSVEIVYLSHSSGSRREYADAVRSIRHISSRSWKSRLASSLCHPGPGAFIDVLTEHAWTNDWLFISLLRVDGKAVSMMYLLRSGSCVHGLRNDFDQDFEHLSPGSYLMWRTIEHLFSSGLARFYLGPGSNDYKQRWADREEVLDRFSVFNNNVRAGCAYLIGHEFKPRLSRWYGHLARIVHRRESNRGSSIDTR